jgi:hypothetical protein
MIIKNSTRWGWFCPHTAPGLEKVQYCTGLLSPDLHFG